MQELWDDSVTPNKMLQQLTFSWFSQKYLAMKKRSEDVQRRVKEILEILKKVKGQARIQALKELRQVVQAYGTAHKTVMENGGVGLISFLLGPFTTHAVGSEIIGVLVNLNLDSNFKSDLLRPAKMSLMVDILNEWSIETKIKFPQLVELMPGLNNECLELVLYLLELFSKIPEGRLALKDCPRTIPNVVKLLMKASENCTQLALSILWAICKFAPEECASLALDAGLAAKLLLAIQSGCNPVLKQSENAGITRGGFENEELLKRVKEGSSFDSNGWFDKVSSTLAIPCNRKFVVDVTGRVTFETIRFILEFLLWKPSDGLRRSTHVVHTVVVQRG
ncbi:Alpha/beta-Hydrolases superfamily protein [Hibiscus syriacus]|uniref:U-box domain-containing protein n=1 Tax=Hibiscus syriacus TaxID=106335 RepID=A0A6A2YTP2_HIBSY|nr:Alpha/beta-Hydrolases superfamily protein [Hibiscus syriacus]